MHAYVLVPKNFMKFMFATVYRVTENDFMHVLTLPRGHLLQLHRYLNDIQAVATCLAAREVLQAEGPTAWPPRSPDLTQLDFFFAWGV